MATRAVRDLDRFIRRLDGGTAALPVRALPGSYTRIVADAEIMATTRGVRPPTLDDLHAAGVEYRRIEPGSRGEEDPATLGSQIRAASRRAQRS
tara:strand:+ start:504 stop:785 length:282 start_codon:yes stop_codon:yes gene_type:complete